MVNSKFFHLDRLTVCYKAPQRLFKDLYPFDATKVGVINMVRKTKDLIKLDRDLRDYSGAPVRQYCHGEYHPRQSWLLWVGSDPYDTKRLPLGELILDENLDPYDNQNCYVFLKLENSFIYHDRQGENDGDYNYKLDGTVKYIEKMLSLTINGISYGEIACDVTYDPVPRMIALFRSGEVDVILRNKTVKDRKQQLPNLWFEMFTSLDEFSKSHLRVKNNGKNELYMYNKSEDIDAKKKDYIYRDYDLENIPLWRMEVRIDNEYAKNFIKKHKCSMSEFLHKYILQEASLPYVWDYYSRKFLRFKINRRKIYNVLEATVLTKDYQLEDVVPEVEIRDVFNKSSQTPQETLATPLGNATSQDNNATSEDKSEQNNSSRPSDRPQSVKGGRVKGYRRHSFQSRLI